MNLDILEKPFESEIIRTRRGQSGRSFSYVEGADYIRRLNLAFDGQWSFEVVDHTILDREVIVIGRLEAEGITKVSFGGSTITVNSQSGQPVSLADDLKAATTDSLKKAASLFGLGLHLNSAPSDRSDGPEPAQRPATKKKQKSTESRKKEEAPKKESTTPETEDSPKKREPRKAARPQHSDSQRTRGSLTERQLNAINAIARSLGWSPDKLSQHSEDGYGAVPEHLSKSQASEFIGELQKLVTRSAA